MYNGLIIIVVCCIIGSFVISNTFKKLSASNADFDIFDVFFCMILKMCKKKIKLHLNNCYCFSLLQIFII